MGSTHGIGIKRNDYRRPNRRENKGHRWRGGGKNVGVGHLERIANTLVAVPEFTRAELIKRACERSTDPRESVETACVNFLRHATSYDTLLRTRGNNFNADAGYIFTLKKVHDAIAEAYPWLAHECETQFLQKRDRVRLIKRRGLSTLTSLHVEEHNAREAAAARAIAEDDETPFDHEYNGALTSLASMRLIFFPPFLKPQEIRERRFGPQMNDRWWEWEEEKGLSTTANRPRGTARR